MSDRNESILNQQIQCKEWFFDFLVKQERTFAVIFSSKDYKVVFLTDNAEKILGVPRESIYNDIRVLLKMGIKLNGTRSIGETLEVDILEARNQETGEVKYFKGSLNHSALNGGDWYLLIWLDITDEVKRNQQMEDMIAVARAANDAKTSFLAKHSHCLT